MSTAPELRVAARWNGRRIVDVMIANGRPQIAASLRGRPVAEARARIPLLFSICRCAQGVAAELACAAAGSGARDSEAAPGTAATRRSEMIQEHLWRLLLDWPIALGLAPRRSDFVSIQRRLRTPGTVTTDAALITELEGWLECEWPAGAVVRLAEGHAPPGGAPCDAATLDTMFATLLAADVPVMPVRDEQFLSRRSAADWAGTLETVPPADYCAGPTLGGIARETGPLERQRNAPPVAALLERGLLLAARYCARVIDLQDCLQGLAGGAACDTDPGCDAAPLPGGGGVARVETARGTLLHAVRIDDDRIADYSIVAPTEWNLHPRGPLAREMQHHEFTGPEPARRHLERLVLALDPCIAFEVSLDTADPRS